MPVPILFAIIGGIILAGSSPTSCSASRRSPRAGRASAVCVTLEGSGEPAVQGAPGDEFAIAGRLFQGDEIVASGVTVVRVLP